MKCKQGDMAIIIRGAAVYIGLVVTCVSLVSKGARLFSVEGILLTTEKPVWHTGRKGINGRFLAVADDDLMPIRPLSEGETEKKENHEPVF